MDLQSIRSIPARYWMGALLSGISAVILYIIISSIWASYRAGLDKIPGPFGARFTRLWIANESRKGESHLLYRQLHEKYGKIVRISPRKVSLSDPALIPIIFGGGGLGKYDKSRLYDCFTATLNGRPLDNIFSTQDAAYHKRMKNIFGPAYAFAALRQMEPLIDECTVKFMDIMKDLAGKPIDFGEWVQWYAFDVIGAITFCKTFGFMDNRDDPRGIIRGIEAGLVYTTVIGQMPELHQWLLGNAQLIDLLMKIPAVARSNPLAIVEKMTLDAMAQYDLEKGSKPLRGDYLEFLRQQQEKDPEALNDRELMSGLFTNLLAGSDTTAMSIRAIFYYLIKTPRAYQKLRLEIDTASRAGRLSPIIEHQQALELPYFQAVLKEALRLHAGISHPLERVVPEGGANLSGEFIPEGTIVGMSAWVAHYNKDVYGQDAEEFRPERWLEADKEKLRIMERTWIPFGHGSRTCIGKNVALLQMSKFVPQVFRRFDFEWASDKDWSIDGYWFSKQNGMVLRLIPREEEGGKA